MGLMFQEPKMFLEKKFMQTQVKIVTTKLKIFPEPMLKTYQLLENF